DADKYLRDVLAWSGDNNVYAASSSFLAGSTEKGPQDPEKPITTLKGWRQFWQTPEASSIEGSVRFVGGNLSARIRRAPTEVTAADFRLRPDSAGYRAGKDGKDLGADVDLVGPGAAYERWKKTPEYQEWLKKTGQLRAETSKPEPGAFVVLGGK